MKSMLRSNKIINIFICISVCLLLCFFTACYGVKSQFATGENGALYGKSVCLIMRIDSNNARLFKKRYVESIKITDLLHCDYVVYANLIENYKTQISGLGAVFHYVSSLNLNYNIFKYDNENPEHQKILKDIIENPAVIDFEEFTGTKNPSLGRNYQEIKRYVRDVRTLNKTQNADIKKLSSVLKQIDSGTLREQNTSISNPLLPTAETQNRIDTNEYLSLKLAEELVNETTFAIMDDNESSINIDKDNNINQSNDRNNETKDKTKNK